MIKFDHLENSCGLKREKQTAIQQQKKHLRTWAIHAAVVEGDALIAWFYKLFTIFYLGELSQTSGYTHRNVGLFAPIYFGQFIYTVLFQNNSNPEQFRVAHVISDKSPNALVDWNTPAINGGFWKKSVSCSTFTLPETNMSPLKIGRVTKGNDRIPTFHFQVLLLLISGRVSCWNSLLDMEFPENVNYWVIVGLGPGGLGSLGVPVSNNPFHFRGC